MATYQNAKKVIKFLTETYKDSFCGIGVFSPEKDNSNDKDYSVFFRYFNSLPEEVLTEINGVKIIAEKHNKMYISDNIQNVFMDKNSK